MREILFRGKRVDNGEWVWGLPIKTYDTEIGKNSADYANPVPVVLMASGRIVLECGCDDVPYFNIDEYPIVNPETVGQYTGLSDKNGRNIFDGDVVRVYYPFDDPENCVVSWSKEGARWDFGGCDAYFCTPSKNCEIIGNIFDNPELLEGDKT